MRYLKFIFVWGNLVSLLVITGCGTASGNLNYNWSTGYPKNNGDNRPTLPAPSGDYENSR